jgi:hypothetical protein
MAGDIWTWTAIDENKLIVTWLIADRSLEAATDFISDLAFRIAEDAKDDLQIMCGRPPPGKMFLAVMANLVGCGHVSGLYVRFI